MKKIRAKSNIVLGLLFLLALLALIAVENGKQDVRQAWYKEKLEAAELTQLASNYLKSRRLEKGIFIDAVNDPNQTALIGQEYTLITTDRGDINAKLSSTNPNFAAVMVQLLKDAGVEKNDHIAIAFTGSFPALNIAVLAAAQTLKLKPIIITSVGASNFGANDPAFTWLDMETILWEANIFQSKSIAASIGGGNDIGRGLSPEGRELILNAIKRNAPLTIHEKHLESSITRRLEIFDSVRGNNPIKAYINVGGGIASLGNSINGKLIQAGLTQNLPMRNYPVRGVIIEMGRKKVPVIHLLNIRKLLAKYDLPTNPVPLPDPGDGGIFSEKRYNMVTTSIAMLILVVVIILVFVAEKRQHQLGTDVVPMTGFSSGDIKKDEGQYEI
jgi:poly-gamma-glutamate system protein